jgi:hypothetical protein
MLNELCRNETCTERSSLGSLLGAALWLLMSTFFVLEARADAKSRYIDSGADTKVLCDATRRLKQPRRSIEELRVDPGAPYAFAWNAAEKRHENFEIRYGYRPQFSPGSIGISPSGAVVVRDRNFNLQFIAEDGEWSRINLLQLARQSLQSQGVDWQPVNGRFAAEYYDGRVVFDRACNAYAFLWSSRSSLDASLMLHSPDGGRTWAAYLIPGTQGYNTVFGFEVPMDEHVLAAPPIILMYDAYARTALRMVAPYFASPDAIAFMPPVTLVNDALVTLLAGGGETQVQSSGDRVFVAYGGREPERNFDGRLGVPAYVAAFDRSTGRLLEGPTLVGVGVNQKSLIQPNNHNLPTLARDRRGFLHVAIGGHHSNLYYRRSSSPDSVSAWDPIEQVGVTANIIGTIKDMYTYPSLAIRDGQPLIAARYSGNGYRFRLVMIQREIGGWGQQKVVLDPGRVFYGHWYNKLSVGHDRVYLNYSYFPANLFSDEVEILERTYGLTLSDPKDSSGNKDCVPTTSTATAARKYCDYTGMRRLNEGNAVIRRGSGNFELLTTKKLLD